MAGDGSFRLYVLLHATQKLLDIYTPKGLDLKRADQPLREDPDQRAKRFADLTEYTKWLVRASGIVSSALLDSFTTVSAPSFDWSPAFVGAENKRVPPTSLIIAYVFKTLDSLNEFNSSVETVLGKQFDGAGFIAIGADPGGGGADHWCPGSADLALFGQRADARRVISAGLLTSKGFTGGNVNVAIIDEGLDQALIPTANWGGGLNYDSGQVMVGKAARTSHGMMIARNVLDLAPNAVLYDVPMMPARITDDTVFVSQAQVVYDKIITHIEVLRLQPKFQGPWILVNAWAIFDRATENPLGSYTENNQAGGHPLNNIVTEAVQAHHFDVIFAAGNCGQFCPSGRCGALDRGPGHSIWGANAHPDVITAGAVRTDGLWLGYSSQGEGPPLLDPQKPDFCAPSQFREDTDSAVINSGTSAACGVTAGVVAALRSNLSWNQTAVFPTQLKTALIGGARQKMGPGWNNRLGHGVLDAAGAIALLPP